MTVFWSIVTFWLNEKFMKLRKLIALFVLLPVIFANAQDKDEVIFTIDGENSYNSEFIRVYQKNKDIVVENEDKSFDDYFE
ncbi:hypothetical protein MNBD_BACTEROID02-1895, partial [hydrothermal vent metagenome]